MRSNIKAALVALGMGAAALSGHAFAMTTLTGTQVSYTFDETTLGKFGSASLVGDDLVFTPATGGFLATGTTPATQAVNVTVTAKSGYLLSAFTLNENGGYTRPTSSDTVYLGGMFSALDIEGTTANKLSTPIAPSAPLGVTGTGINGNWTSQSGLTLPGTGWGGADGLVQSVSLTISNQLFAGGAGKIWKNQVGVAAIATPVPEADTYAMLLAGLAVVGFMTRRASPAV